MEEREREREREMMMMVAVNQAGGGRSDRKISGFILRVIFFVSDVEGYPGLR